VGDWQKPVHNWTSGPAFAATAWRQQRVVCPLSSASRPILCHVWMCRGENSVHKATDTRSSTSFWEAGGADRRVTGDCLCFHIYEYMKSDFVDTDWMISPRFRINLAPHDTTLWRHISHWINIFCSFYVVFSMIMSAL
jgi:hypothetical protein